MTKEDSFPLPFTEECLDTLEGTQFISTLSIHSGCCQIEMNPGDTLKTAFLTKYGLFEFTHMSFGLCNVFVTFSMLYNCFSQV